MTRNWLRFLRRVRPLRRSPSHRCSPPPTLDVLEDRCLPSVVLTAHNDPARTGANLSETTLTPANVNSSQFGKLFSVAVDGQVYAQPLYLAGLAIPGQGTHDVVFVATEHDSVYACDATSGAVLWHDSFINPSAGVTTVPASDVNCGQISPEIGITDTPVIDPSTGTLYLVAMTKEVSGSTNYVQRLHALNVGTGAEKFGGPVAIHASVKNANGGTVTFVPKDYKERAALALVNGVVYTSWASHCDINGEGWVMGYSASTLQQVSVYCTVPNGSLATIWQSNGGPAVDGAGNLYVMTGNGTFDANTGGNDYGDSFVKLATSNGLTVADYFTPYNEASLNNGDTDLGSGGPILIPAGPGSQTTYVVGAGKEGKIYLLNSANLGHFNASGDNVVQELPNAIGGEWGVPAYFNGTVYFGGVGDTLKAFTLSNGLFNASPSSRSSTSFSYPGTTPSVSANGSSDGIVWAIENGSHAVLHAYDATNLASELYNSAMAGGRDQLDAAVKFTTPTIADGKVFVGTASTLTVFGGLTDLNWSGGGLSGVPSTADTATSFTITRSYNVSSAAVANDFTISYYASASGTPNPATDALLGAETISAAADKAVGLHTATSPALQFPSRGTWYVYAYLDSGNTVAERNETNNIFVAPQQVTVTGAVIVHNGDPGYTESGPDWQDRQTSLGYGGVLAYAPAGTGQDTASWQFTNLAPGNYDVEATWYAYPNRADNAPYNVYDGSTLLTASPILVNQQVAPSGTAVNGFQFQSLGAFSVQSGSLKVVLSNNADGYVFAEAIRVVPLKPPLIVDNGQPGYTESGPDWQDRQTSLGYGGNLAYAPAGTGQDTASWQVTNLAPGSYDVEATWYAFSNRATNAPYNVYDGNTLLTPTPILVNQQLAPSGITVNGFQFQSLGAFTIQSGTLRVVLSNNANGYVFADALRVAPNKPPFIVDNGQPGYAESGPDWQDRQTSLGYGGNLAYAPAGTGQDTASWQFTNLAAGSYDVEATWYAFSNRATNAPYNVYDGNTLLTPNPILVNQQQAPSGTTVSGFQFQSLGHFSIQSGTLKVVLSNNANGYVFADALRVAPYKITVVVDNGQAGYTESGPDWQDRTTSLGYGGNLAYAPAGTGQDTVTWLVSNLPAGTYDVEVTWYAFSNRADNAPYKVYDGNTLLTSTPVRVNQQLAPSGTAVNGFMFQSLGQFTIQSGTLKVVLSNDADGYVIADALRVMQV